ncbi:hypothetical protein C7271_07900 [filamentous cyanobacterium CCP5]|nr:hypothetical protein C7271_07900 [filamentous cyanobacterium CCP5]
MNRNYLNQSLFATVVVLGVMMTSLSTAQASKGELNVDRLDREAIAMTLDLKEFFQYLIPWGPWW